MQALRILYRAEITGGELEVERDGTTDDVAWHPIASVPQPIDGRAMATTSSASTASRSRSPTPTVTVDSAWTLRHASHATGSASTSASKAHGWSRTKIIGRHFVSAAFCFATCASYSLAYLAGSFLNLPTHLPQQNL